MAEEAKKSETLDLFICRKTAMYCGCLSCVCCGRGFPHRLLLTIMLMSGIILCYTHRVCLSLAITEMTIPQNSSKTATVDPEACKTGTSIERPVIWDIQGGKYDWDEGTQSYILMAFYIGYLFSNIPAGFLCDFFGAKWVICGGVLISSILTLLTPFMIIYTSWHFIVVLRVAMGIGQSPLYPGAALMVARWVPQAERTLVGGVVLASLSLGTILGNIPTAFILTYLKSWVWVFYMYGMAGVIYCVLFGIFIYSSPAEHPFITPEETEYLSTRIVIKSKHKIPIWAILADITVWGCIFCQIGNDYILYTIITNFPKYLTDVLKFTSQEAGFWVCLPQTALFIGSISFGALTDALIVHCNVKIVNIRIVNTFLASTVPSTCLLICCLLRCNSGLAILTISFGMFVKAMFYAGLKLTLIDITSNHTALISAIVNAAGGFAGIASPYTIGKIASENTFKQWDTISYITILIAFASVVPYALFCKGERRPWDYDPGTEPAPDPNAKTGCVTIFSCVNKH